MGSAILSGPKLGEIELDRFAPADGVPFAQDATLTCIVGISTDRSAATDAPGAQAEALRRVAPTQLERVGAPEAGPRGFGTAA